MSPKLVSRWYPPQAQNLRRWATRWFVPRSGGAIHDECLSLVVDGRRERTCCGCGSDILRRELWDVRELRGRTASIEIVDGSAVVGSHVVVDEITLWTVPPR